MMISNEQIPHCDSAGSSVRDCPSQEPSPADEHIERDLSEIVVLDEETMTLINAETGEVVGAQDTPAEDAPAVEIAKWVGERRDWHKGKLIGLQAEKQYHLEKIAKIYDPQIDNHTRAIAWIGKQYEGLLFNLARQLIGDAKKRSVAVGTLLLKLRRSKPSVDVQDNDKAVAYLGWLVNQQAEKIDDLSDKLSAAGEAGDDDTISALNDEIERETMLKSCLVSCINTKKSVYKSSLPENLKEGLTLENLDSTGMVFDAGGEEKLEIE